MNIFDNTKEIQKYVYITKSISFLLIDTFMNDSWIHNSHTIANTFKEINLSAWIYVLQFVSNIELHFPRCIYLPTYGENDCKVFDNTSTSSAVIIQGEAFVIYLLTTHILAHPATSYAD